LNNLKLLMIIIYMILGDNVTEFEEVKKLGKPVKELDIF